jgi:hypothetical protein
MLTKHDERKMPKNLGHIQSLARSHTRTAIKVLAGIMNEKTCQPMARIVAAKALLDRGWGKCAETHHVDVNDGGTLLKVVNEIVHVHETREQIEFKDQTPLLEVNPTKNGGNTHSQDSAPRPSFSRCWRRRATRAVGAQRLAMYPRQCRA